MTHLYLLRAETPRQCLGTLSVFYGDIQRARAFTLELPWRDNERFASCIPYGQYPVVHRHSRSHGAHLHVQQVPGRRLILLHAGNYLSDTAGCILLGHEFADLDGDGLVDVSHSRQTLKRIVRAADDISRLHVMRAANEELELLPPQVRSSLEVDALHATTRRIATNGDTPDDPHNRNHADE